MPRMAPRSTKPANQSSLATCSASDTVSSIPLNCMYGTMPVMMADTTTYNSEQIPSDHSTPRGMSLSGFLTSSAAQVTASKPRKLKNTIAAPWNTPLMPYGSAGCQLAGFTCHTATAMNTSTTATLISTTILLTRFDSLIPNASSVVTSMAMTNAGRLNTVVTPGRAPAAAVSASGRYRTKPAIRLWK